MGVVVFSEVSSRLLICEQRREAAMDAHLEKIRSQHRPSMDRRIAYFTSALMATAVPIYLYYSIYNMNLIENAILFIVVSAATAGVITFAYHNVAFLLWTGLLASRVKNFTNAKVVKGAGENIKDARARTEDEQEGNTHSEAIAFSMLYNNAFFFFLVVMLGFYLPNSTSGPTNYVVTMILASGILSFTSAASL